MRTVAPAILSLLAFTADAGAQIADNMTCAEAVAYYERNGRINKIAHGKDVIPIYNGVPVSKRNQLRCDHGYQKVGYSLKTKDNRRCTISYVCTPTGWDR
jgi:hypothetical protein